MRTVSEKNYQVWRPHGPCLCSCSVWAEFGNEDLGVISREEPIIITGVGEMLREIVQRRKPCGCHTIWGSLVKDLLSKDVENVGGDTGQGLVTEKREF